VQGARRFDTGEQVDIQLIGGKIHEIRSARGSRETQGQDDQVLDLAGHIVSPGFVEAHFHLDKCFASEVELPGGSLDEQLKAFARAKAKFTPDDVAERACRMAKIMLSRGVTTLRSYADVDQTADLRLFEGLREAQRRLKGMIDLQVVAFPQMGIFTHPDTLDLLKRCLSQGINAIGGHSELERSSDDTARQIDLVFRLAREYNVDADFHIDETDDPNSRWLEFCTRKAIEYRHFGRTNMGHACSIIQQDEPYRRQVYDLLREADATIASSPTSGLLFRGLDQVNPPRGITAVKEMLEVGVNVVCAQETYKSVFSRHLRLPDPLFTGQLMAYMAKLSDEEGLRKIFRMLTFNAAKALGVKNYGLEAGCRADLVFLKADSIFEALTLLSPERMVMKDGRVVARSRYSAELIGFENGAPSEIRP
jgi:cytosine deaminase